MTIRTHTEVMDQNAYDNLWKENAALRAQHEADQARIQELQAITIKISEGVDPVRALKQQLAQVTGRLERQDEELARLREALEYYADPSTYHAVSFVFDSPTGGFEDDFDDGHPSYDRPMPGKAARAALKGVSMKVLAEVDETQYGLLCKPEVTP